MKHNPSVALIGAGAMGGSLLRGWLAAGSINTDASAVFDPAPSDAMVTLCDQHGVRINPEIDQVDPDVTIVAVKPQKADEALPPFSILVQNSIVLSVMAGKSISRVSSLLGNAKRVARSMPNLPAAIGKGVTGLYAPPSIDSAGRHLMEHLMKAAGDTVWVETEQGIDFVTAVSGSGPAYFFLLAEAMADAGAKIGLSPEAASRLARATLIGAGALIETDPRSVSDMRKAVTSPGGTTQAALDIFDGDERALRKLAADAVAAAAARAGELTD